MNTRNIAILALLLVPTMVRGQPGFNESALSPEVLAIVSRIAKTNSLMSAHVGIVGKRTKQYDDFEELARIAGHDALVALTDHPNAVVRCYAAWGLIRYRNVDVLPIVLRHLDDTACVRTHSGCIVSTEFVGDVMVDAATESRPESPGALDAGQRHMLDSVLMYRPNRLVARRHVLDRVQPTAEMYPRIRTLAVDEGDPAALVVLAKYRRQEDVPVILSARDLKSDNGRNKYYYTFKAIAEFPHPEFLPFLESKLNETLGKRWFSAEWPTMYAAIAAFRNGEAVRLLRIPFDNVRDASQREQHMRFVFQALHAMRDPIFDELLWDLWEYEHLLTRETCEYLFEKDSARAFRLTTASLRNPDALSDGEVSTLRYDRKMVSVEEQLLAMLLDIQMRHDRAAAYEIIRTNIARAGVGTFAAFAKMAHASGDTAFAEPLLQRIAVEDNPHVYLDAIDALLAFRESSINARVLAVCRNNPRLSEGRQAKMLDVLLRKYGVR